MVPPLLGKITNNGGNLAEAGHFVLVVAINVFACRYCAMKTFRIAFGIMALPPAIFICSLLLFYVHAGQKLGHLPYYNNPDPKELGEMYSWYSPVIYSGFLASLLLFPFFVYLIVKYVIRIKGLVEKNTEFYLCLGLYVVGFTLRSTGIFEWFFD